MAHVRRLLSAALVAGAISGLAAFGVQHIMVEPLLLKAEIYEDAARRTQAEGAHAGHEWKPSDGFERTAFTCLSTVLTGVGYAALLLGLAATLDVRLESHAGRGRRCCRLRVSVARACPRIAAAAAGLGCGGSADTSAVVARYGDCDGDRALAVH